MLGAGDYQHPRRVHSKTQLDPCFKLGHKWVITGVRKGISFQTCNHVNLISFKYLNLADGDFSSSRVYSYACISMYISRNLCFTILDVLETWTIGVCTCTCPILIYIYDPDTRYAFMLVAIDRADVHIYGFICRMWVHRYACTYMICLLQGSALIKP